jgi:biopolymer transport protein ExbB/TolQ
MDSGTVMQTATQTATQVAQVTQTASSMGFLSFIRDHLSHSMPLLVAAAVAIAIIWERSRALFFVYPMKNSDGFFDQITQLVNTGRTADAVALCDKWAMKPMTRVVKGALTRAHLPEGMIENGVQYELGEAQQMIQRRTSFLATIANVATLLGLFGTIAGLIQSFEAVGSASPQLKSKILSDGISVAMNATMLGLAVAIPCMIAFSFLMNSATRLSASMESTAIRVMEILKQRYYSIEAQETRTYENGKTTETGRAA